MYESFLITTIRTDIRKKQIIIDATSDFDEDTVNDKTVQVFERKTKEVAEYTFEIKQKRLILTLTSWPIPNLEYVIKISDVLNVIGDKLQQGVRKTIVFESSLCSIVHIVYPAHGEEISDLRVILQEEVVEESNAIEEFGPANSFYIEVSTDCNFHNVVKSITIQDRLLVDLPDLPSGEYFVRSRVQKEEEYGLWSETVGFVLSNNSYSDTEEDEDFDEIYIDDLEVVSIPEKGFNVDNILIEFSHDIDQDSLDNLIVIRRDY